MRRMKDMVQANWVTSASNTLSPVLPCPHPLTLPPPSPPKKENQKKVFKILFIISQVHLWILFLVTNYNFRRLGINKQGNFDSFLPMNMTLPLDFYLLFFMTTQVVQVR